MAIRGSLKEASLPDVLQLLAMGKKTGCLSVAHKNNFGYIYFDKGRICYASVVNRRDRTWRRVGQERHHHSGASSMRASHCKTSDATSAWASCSSKKARSRSDNCTMRLPSRSRRQCTICSPGTRERSTSKRTSHRTTKTWWCRSIPNRCCSKAPAEWTNGDWSKRRSPRSTS